MFNLVAASLLGGFLALNAPDENLLELPPVPGLPGVSEPRPVPMPAPPPTPYPRSFPTSPSSDFRTDLRLEISLSRRRLTLFQGATTVKQYPIAVGKAGWETPVGQFEVRQMFPNPPWRNPFTGVVIPGGSADNPLGRHWIGFWTDGKNWIGMHGTPTPSSVGQAASHGCIRMFNRDIEDLFGRVAIGTAVRVVR